MLNLGIERTGAKARGRKPPDSCVHTSPVLVERVGRGYGARCLACGMVGPVRDSSEEAWEALQVAIR